MHLNEILQKIPNVKKQGNDEYTGRCPSHDDKQNSLSISEGTDSRILLYCHAGCSTEKIVEAMGIKLSDLYPEKEAKDRKQVAEYLYKDLAGNVIHKTIRFEPKGFTQCRPDGKDSWIYNLKDIKTVLYNLQMVTEAINKGETVYIVEGEKDVDNLAKLGLTATTSPQGAGKWKDYYSDYLTNSIIAIIPDNDTVGKSHSEQVAKSLQGKAKSIKVIDLTNELPELPLKGDITDFFKVFGKKNGLEALKKLVDNTQEWQPQQEQKEKSKTPDKIIDALSTIDASELSGKDLPPVMWVIYKMITTGLYIFASPPKYGKSWLWLWILIRFSKGLDIWGNETSVGTCLYLALEDSLTRLQTRLNKLLNEERAPENLHFATMAHGIGNGLIQQLESFIHKHPDTRLIVIDTLQKVRNIIGNQNGYAADYQDSAVLKTFADQHNIAIVCIHHLRKMADDDPLNQVSGTTGIIGAADGIYVLKKADRMSEEATLYSTGRDIEASQIVIKFNKQNCVWEFVSGDAESFQEDSAFYREAVTVLIQRLVNENNPMWEGTPTDLFANIMNLLTDNDDNLINIPSTPIGLGAKLRELQFKLSKLNITLREKRGKKRLINLTYNKVSKVSNPSQIKESSTTQGYIEEVSKVSKVSTHQEATTANDGYDDCRRLAENHCNIDNNNVCDGYDDHDDMLSDDDAINFLRNGGELEI